MKTNLPANAGLVCGALLLLVALGAQAGAVDYKKRFQWEDLYSELEEAASLAPKDGVARLLKAIAFVRVGVAMELRRHCTASTPRPICEGDLGNPVLEDRIEAELDEEVRARSRAQGSMTSADYQFRTIGPFSVVTALRSNRVPYAALVFELSEGSPTSRMTFVERFGPPLQEVSDQDGNTVLVYRSSQGGFGRLLRVQLRKSGPAVGQVTVSVERK